MATYEYYCEPCNAITELVQPMRDPTPDSITCGFCAAPASFKYSTPSIMRSGMTASKTPSDVAVGRDAEARWASINQRQDKRNQVRREHQTQGLKARDYTTFEPITTDQKITRTRALNAVERQGYRTDSELERVAK